ncbi:MAG TPA: hypothetical protein VNJ08_12200 [Bacteriovoracaceae bacterium]|nr:hypothetical protein [Bacteriovoracaceae bacterium]
MNTILKFFKNSQDDEVIIRLFTFLTGSWVLLNFISQLPIYFSLWESVDSLILERGSHGIQLPMVLDILTYFPSMTPFVFIGTITCAVLLIAGRSNILIRFLIWYFVWILDAKAWTVLDGGNNLIHLTLFYSILLDYRYGSLEIQQFIRKIGLRAIQLQVVMVYLCAFHSKVGGDLWINGTALYYIAQVDKFQSLNLLALFKAVPFSLPFLVYSTMIIQLLIATTLWIKNFRLLPILLGTLVHLGIASTMGLVSFSLVMIVHYSAFLGSSELSIVKRLYIRYARNLVSLLFIFIIVGFGTKLTSAKGSAYSHFLSKMNVDFIMENLNEDSRIFIYHSSTNESEIIRKHSISILKEKDLNQLELELGSITKLITAIEFLKMEKKGILHRSDLITLPDGKTVSMNELLFHSSGIHDNEFRSYLTVKDKNFQYSNANYSLVGKYIKEKKVKYQLDEYVYYPNFPASSALIKNTKRPLVEEFNKAAWGIITSPLKLKEILQDINLNNIPCLTKGKCWGGYRSGKRFITIGKLTSGTTLASVDEAGEVIILSSNDFSINLEKIFLSLL